ncbi:MAG: extracellular solute-binding protein [Micavibrio sp.]|nr:extracellular solute-binding protein [Micavibrio sp.]
MFKYTLLIVSFFLLFSVNSYAGQKIIDDKELFGLSMHGNAKYSRDATHLDYVNPNAPKGGSIKTAAGKGTFDTLNPFALKGTAAEGLNLVYGRLMSRVWDEPFTMYPLIAERVDVPADRSFITFYINQNARFSDGTPITPDDVIYSFNILKEKGRPNMRRVYKLVSTVERIAEMGIKFNLGDGYDRETVMILALMPVLSKEFWEPRDFEATLLETPVTNGPYKIQSIDAGRSITYERDPNYWAKDLFQNIGHFNFDTITYEYFRDDTVALEAFNKGGLNYRFEADTSKWEKSYIDDPSIVKYEAPHQRPEKTVGFIMNTRRAPLDNLEVRRAISLAFDDEWIAKNIYFGKQKRVNSFFANSTLSGAQKETIKTSIRKNLLTAAKILDESGWAIQNGIRTKDGKPLTLELVLNSPNEEKLALNFKKQLQRIGIKLDIRVVDTATFQQRRNDYNYDMILHYWQNSLSPGSEQMVYWTCEAAEQPGRFNYAGICTKDIDALASKIADAKTYDELIYLAQNLDQKLLEQNILIPFFYSGYDKIAYRKPLKHPATTPIYGSIVETWWMEVPEKTN